MSAHGFRPPLLLFSTTVVQVSPSTRRASQYLHIVCFTAGLKRILALSETDRRSVTRRRPVPADRGFPCAAGCPAWSVLEAWVRYVAACWRKEIREYSGRFWTGAADFPLAMKKTRRWRNPELSRLC